MAYERLPRARSNGRPVDQQAASSRGSTSDFGVELSPSSGGAVRVTVHGTVDLRVHDLLRAMLAEAVAVPETWEVEVDLAGVRLLDAGGVGVLVGELQKANAAGKTLRVSGVRALPLTVLEVTGADKILGATP